MSSTRWVFPAVWHQSERIEKTRRDFRGYRVDRWLLTSKIDSLSAIEGGRLFLKRGSHTRFGLICKAIQDHET